MFSVIEVFGHFAENFVGEKSDSGSQVTAAGSVGVLVLGRAVFDEVIRVAA